MQLATSEIIDTQYLEECVFNTSPKVPHNIQGIQHYLENL